MVKQINVTYSIYNKVTFFSIMWKDKINLKINGILLPDSCLSDHIKYTIGTRNNAGRDGWIILILIRKKQAGRLIKTCCCSNQSNKWVKNGPLSFDY